MRKLFFFLTIIALVACGPSKQVTRIDSKEVVDLSGKWNDTDSRLVAEEMIKDVISRPWLTDYLTAKSRKPVLIVGKVRNKSSEHIATDVFIKNIERELLNSGKVSFVASKEERDQVREERRDQQDFASQESFKQFYKELGADFMLSGEINSIADSYDGEKVMLYQVDLQLIDIETNQKVWLGSKSIKKFISRDKYRP